MFPSPSSSSNRTVRCGCLRVAGVRVADRLADSQREQSLVAGVGQWMNGLREHAGWSSVDPSQELEEEIQTIAEDEESK